MFWFLRRVLPGLAILVLFLAILIGSIGKAWPQLFLRIPKFGFIPWAITGNHMPPNFEATPLEEAHFRRWAQDGDIILATMAKAGTVWLGQILKLLKSKGQDDLEHFKNADEMLGSGMVELLRYPEDDLNQRIERENKRRVPGMPMTWASHLSPSEANYGMDVRRHPKIKYIGIVRDGKEVARSIVPFFGSFPDEWRALWGGFPPALGKEEVVRMMSKELSDMFFGYVKAWWPLRHEPNVLLLHYADLKRNTRKEVEKVAKFLGIDAAAYMDQVLEKSVIAHMQKHKAKFVSYFGKNRDIPGAGGHINKGESGGAGEFFTAEMNRTWDRAMATHFADSEKAMVDWATNGGDFQ